jgi:DNA-directed RNA polymerase specialized sigma24 family protein
MNFRAVFQLFCCYESYSTVEIAEILKKDPSTVRGYLHNGRKLLRMEMEESDFK